MRHREIGEAVPLAPGQTITLLDTDRAGTLVRLWVTLDDIDADPFSLRSARLEARWDGAHEPAIRVPLGDFFGVGHGVGGELVTEPATVLGRGLTSYWPMAFEAAKLTLTHDGPGEHLLFYQVDWIASESVAPLRLQASWRRDAAAHAEFTVAEIQGQGHYVGTVLALVPSEPGWWGEGDDQYVVDGTALPGTGTEDFVNQAWGIEARNTPYAAVLDGKGRRVTLSRWFVRDPVLFSRSLTVKHELQGYKKQGARTDDVAATALWYQAPPLSPVPELPADRAPGAAVPVESWRLPGPATPVALAPLGLRRTGSRFLAPMLLPRDRRLAGVDLSVSGCEGVEGACGWRLLPGTPADLPVGDAESLYLLLSARGARGTEVLEVDAAGSRTTLRLGEQLDPWEDSWPVEGGRMITAGEDGTTLKGAFVVPLPLGGARVVSLKALTEDGVALWAASTGPAPR